MVSAERKNSRVILGLLGIILLAVWGDVGYRVLWGDNSVSDEHSQINKDITTASVGTNIRFKFGEDVRDPFSFRPNAKHKKPSLVKPTISLWVPPPIRFEGVLIRKGMKTAIVESQDGKILFVSVGDTIMGVNVIGIEDHVVKYRYENKDTSWVMLR